MSWRLSWDCCLLSLHLNKRVVVANHNLRVMYNVLFLLSMLFCGAVSLYTKGFMSKLPVKVSPDIQYRAVYKNATNYPVCHTPRGWLNNSVTKFGADWTAFREPCYYSCGLQEATLFGQSNGNQCVSPERLAVIHTYQDVFLRTSIIKYYSGNATLPDFFFIEKFYAFAEDMAFDISYTYYVDAEPSWFFNANPKRKPTDAVSVFGTTKEAITILLDAVGAIYKIFVKVPRVLVSVRELITLAQNTPLSLRGDQHLPAEVLRSGISISVEVKCFNDPVDLHYLKTFSGYHLVTEKVQPSTKQPACVMSFIKVSDVAHRDYGEFIVETPSFNISGKDPIFQQLGGIQLKAHDCYSIMRFPEIYHIMLEVASLIVILSLPSKVMRFVMQHFLGNLSTAYRAILNEPLNLSEVVVLWAVRAVAHMTLFANLLDNFSTKQKPRYTCHILEPAGNKTMPASTFEVLLQHALADVKDTDPTKVGNLAHFTMQAMLAESEEGWDLQTPGKLPPVTTSTHISALHFLSACRSDSDLPYSVMMKLLDSERPLGLGERFFFPSGLREAMSAATASNKSLSEEVERAGSRQNDSNKIKELQNQLTAYHSEQAESWAQMNSALESAMKDIKTMKTDFDLAHNEMEIAYQDLNRTRLELEHAKTQLEKASGSESEMPNVPHKTIKAASPKFPGSSAINSLPQDWFQQIEQIGKDMDKRLTVMDRKIASATSAGKNIPDAFGADERRRLANSVGEDDKGQLLQILGQSQSQYSKEYTDLKRDIGDIELSLKARIDEVLFRCTALEDSLQALTNNICNESIVRIHTASKDSDTARHGNKEYWRGLGFTVRLVEGKEDAVESSTRNNGDV